MKSLSVKSIALLVMSVLSVQAHAGDSVEQSLQALGYTIEGGFKMVSAAAAIPLVTAGEIGAVSGEIGHELLDEAARPPGQYHANQPLPVTDEVITAGPEPDQELKNRE